MSYAIARKFCELCCSYAAEIEDHEDVMGGHRSQEDYPANSLALLVRTQLLLLRDNAMERALRATEACLREKIGERERIESALKSCEECYFEDAYIATWLAGD